METAGEGDGAASLAFCLLAWAAPVVAVEQKSRDRSRRYSVRVCVRMGTCTKAHIVHVESVELIRKMPGRDENRGGRNNREGSPAPFLCMIAVSTCPCDCRVWMES